MKKAGVKRADRWKDCDLGVEIKQDASIKKIKKLGKLLPVKKYNTSNKTSTFSDTNTFYSKVAPTSVKDLAVHPKKIQEVQEWIKLNVLTKATFQKHSPLLLLSGPTGCGKTHTVNLICKEMGITVSEWINPLDQDFELFRTPSQIGNFVEFLTESKWNSLFDTGNLRVTLIKDIPNVLIHHPEEFFNVLEQCYYKTNYPIIFICTDASSSDINLSRTLFPEEIINKYNVTHISFNACAPSLMKNVIKQAKVIVEENSDMFKQPSTTTIDAILASSMGDIRNAINQFYFASLIGTEELPVVINSFQKIGGHKRKRNDKATTIQCMSRDENLGLFHGLGRVLNPKRNETGISWRLHYNVEKLVDEFSVQPSKFISFLFENYLKYFGDINDASRAADVLSFAAKFLDNWNDRYETLVFGLWVSVSGLMIFNEHKVSKWNQIRGPVKIMQRIPNSSEGVGLKSMDYFYYDYIKKTDKFHKFKTS